MVDFNVSEISSPENTAEPSGSPAASEVRPITPSQMEGEVRVALPNPNYSLLRAGLRKARGIKKNFSKSQDLQINILLYLYNHPALSMPKLRSMFNLTKITSWRIMGRLKRCKFVRFSGSHKNGSYVITQEGKIFIEQGGRL
ncbi:MAG: MarR family winged helix-turn-helix transcriptional regulator [Bacteroidota bacterium]